MKRYVILIDITFEDFKFKIHPYKVRDSLKLSGLLCVYIREGIRKCRL